ncbi:hypothetical protein [Clostridium aminobutyricum]|uniref:DUF2007 domain-containing protein n=1 Tax=Clostridium aminobutyricum TaxID=33953 RepID=A0A939DAU5_CLOAM|nr:hypothetical protein [Clostridium aminobutyricum]MBN7774330.1 hypothetical protein [Clostridium aminobutyricum]
MIMIWNRKEVLVGWSMEQFYEVRQILANNKIKYTYKVVNNGGATRGRMGRFGENMQYSVTNYVYVHKKDYDYACGLLRNIRF